ncbi:unnamed protein product [Candida verbasci]|uniref:Palmitoyl-protein thioesterase 1 n=1 Tax=Candida verbasci TaxID=1227364 RepID=A0A9W4X9Z7_9ASCO|nr:unnamed protein product [Candida verbasci]
MNLFSIFNLILFTFTSLFKLEDIKRIKPVVIWHGLGDNYNSSGIHRVSEIINEIYPNTFIYSIYLDEDPSTDEQNSYFGDANIQISQICAQLSNITELFHGFNIIGFSQGGVLSRGLIERCSGLVVENFVSFGSPHLGVLEVSICESNDWICRRRNQLLKRQIWNDNIQKHLIPAQYFRDHEKVEYAKYLKYSNLLADINNERKFKNKTYVENMKKLNKLILVNFLKDTTVIPKESSMFYDYDKEKDIVIPMIETEIYQKNYIGLKDLNEEGKIVFLNIDEAHMRISDQFIRELFINFF